MQLEHTFTVPVSIEEAWSVLTDIERVAPCMPGAALDTVDGDDFTGTVKVKLGPINLTYKGKASFVEKDAAMRRAVLDAHGRDARGNGTAAAKVTATLVEDGTSTKVDVITHLDITGKPAQFGRGVMVDVGAKLLGQFADCLAATLRADGAAAGVAVEAAEAVAAPVKKAAAKKAPAKKAAAKKTAAKKTAAAAKSTGAAATAPTRKAAAEATTEEQPSAPDITEAPVTTPPPITKPLRPTADEIEPVDLIQAAGPAVAKRAAPPLIVLLLLLLWRRRRRRRRAAAAAAETAD